MAGRGYLAAYQQAGDKTFTGELNVSDIPVENLTVTGTSGPFRGWHLLGNPYSCALSWYTGWETDSIGGVAYTWNEAGMSYTPRNPGDVIPACNGFMVQVTGDPGNPGSLTIPASMRMHSTQGWFKESGYPVIILFARSLTTSAFQESQVRLNPSSTAGFDPACDGRFLPGYAPVFYSMTGDEKLAVNSLPGIGESLSIPFSFVKNQGDRFQIEARVSGEPGSRILLADKKTGYQQDLLRDPEYTFTSAEGDDPQRFELRFSRAGNGEPPGQRWRVAVHGSNLVISWSGDVRLELFSILGKSLFSRELHGGGTETVDPGAPPGWYLVRLTSGTISEVSKVFIQSSSL